LLDKLSYFSCNLIAKIEKRLSYVFDPISEVFDVLHDVDISEMLGLLSRNSNISAVECLQSLTFASHRLPLLIHINCTYSS
jgi:hypothetical protein